MKITPELSSKLMFLCMEVTNNAALPNSLALSWTTRPSHVIQMMPTRRPKLALLCSTHSATACLSILTTMAFPPFNRKYGELQPDGLTRCPRGGRLVSPMVPSAVRLSVFCVRHLCMYRVATTTNHPSVTDVFVERFGYRPFLLGALCYLCGAVAIFFCAPTIKFCF